MLREINGYSVKRTAILVSRFHGDLKADGSHRLWLLDLQRHLRRWGQSGPAP